MKPSLDLGIKGRGQMNADLPGAGPKKASGSIQGTHYDPDSATANRGLNKKRPAPVVGQGNPKRGQPSQSKKQPTQPVPQSAIIMSSELQALRDYNAMMNEKMKSREETVQGGDVEQIQPQI